MSQLGIIRIEMTKTGLAKCADSQWFQWLQHFMEGDGLEHRMTTEEHQIRNCARDLYALEKRIEHEVAAICDKYELTDWSASLHLNPK